MCYCDAWLLSVSAGGVPGPGDNDPDHPVLRLLPDAEGHPCLPLVGVVPLLRALQLRGTHAGSLRERKGEHALLPALLPLQEP